MISDDVHGARRIDRAAAADGSWPSVVRVEPGWSPYRTGELYSSAVMFAGDQWIDVVYFGKRMSHDGALKSSALEGAETTCLALDRIDRRVTRIALVLKRFSSEDLDEIESCDLCVSDEATGCELADIRIASIDPHAAMMVVAVLRRQRRRRTDDCWALKVVGAANDARRFAEINAAIRSHL